MSICTVGISCEQIRYCEHRINLAVQECLFCKMQKQINALTDSYKHLSIMVAGCQDHHVRQIDENRKISKRVDELEEKISEKYAHPCIIQRIEKLENLIDVKKAEQIICDGANLHLTILKFEKRMKELEDQINAFDEDAEYLDSLSLPKRIERLENIIKDNQGLIGRIGILGEALHTLSEENNKLKKTPHKCPVCDGHGRLNLKEPLITKNSTCYSISCVPCEGKGIIWS